MPDTLDFRLGLMVGAALLFVGQVLGFLLAKVALALYERLS